KTGGPMSTTAERRPGRTTFLVFFSSCLFVSFVDHSVRADGPWSTYRGNPQRTGHTDGKAGPANPKVLWAFKSKEHFIASPVPQGDRVYVSGVGVFQSTFYCLAG